jgi:branched-chain amino acid transport system substrate-binding protein
MNLKRQWPVIGALAASAMVLAGCSSSGNSGSTGGSTPTSASASSASSASAAAAAPKLTGATIRIGFIDALTGRNTQGVQSASLAAAWVKWVNANGGIGGHPVQVIVEDSKNDPGTAQTVVQDLVQNQHVVALMIDDTTAEASIAPYVASHHIAMIGGFGASPATWSALPNWFTMGTTVPTFIYMGAAAAEATGATSFGAATCTDTATCAAVGPLYKVSSAAEGLKFAGVVGMPDNAPSYTAQCLTLIQGGANSIVLSIPPDTASFVVNDCTQQGFKGSYVLSGSTFQQSQFSGDKGTTFVGGLNGFPWWSSAAPVKQFRAVLAQYAPSVDYRDAATTVIWTTLELFRKAIGDPIGQVTTASVIKDYDSLHGETLAGLLPQPLTFTAGKPAPQVNCFWMYKYTGGDTNPVSVHTGASGNGAQGDLASTCYKS